MPDRVEAADDPPPACAVALIISNLEYGGAERQVVELANNMDPARFDVHICSLSECLPLAQNLKDRARLHVIRKKSKFDLTVVVRLARLLRSLNAAIVQGYLFDAEIAARLAGSLAGTPVIIGSERNTDYPVRWSHRLASRLTRRFLDLVIANSGAGAEFNSRTFGLDRSLYRVVHNGVDTDRFVPLDGRPMRRQLGIGDDDFVVGVFASFKRQKNHGMFFRAARQALARVPKTRFVLVGDTLQSQAQGSDKYKREMRQLVADLGLDDRCLFLGNRDDVEQLYPACDVTALSSTREGTPNVLLESMACGVPVVATAVSDNAQVVPDGQVGYIVPLGDDAAMADRLSRLLEDNALRQEMSGRARAWVEQEFSTVRLAQKTEAVYAEVLSLKRRPGLP